MGFSRQEYWSGLPFPSPRDLPDPGIESGSPALQADALTSEPPYHKPNTPLHWTRDQISNIRWIIDKPREFQKNIYFCFIDYAKAFNYGITTNSGKFWERWEYQTTWPASWEICMQVKKQQLELDMEKQTHSKLGKEYVKVVYCHPAYLTYM